LHIFEGKENLTEIRQGLARGNDSALSPREAVKKFLNMLL
jgi:hypothetical protein